MANRRIPPATKAKYQKLRANGLSQKQAATECKISTATAHRWDMALGPSIDSLKEELSRERRPPKAWHDLDDLGKRCLDDFELFATTFFCLRVPAWWRIAAKELVNDVLSPDNALTLLHAPSGAGKTTLLETLVAWLMSGGGVCDPEQGRSLRFLFGSATVEKATRSVDRLRRIVEDPRPYWDAKQRLQAEHSLVEVYGRYKPEAGEGDDTSVWRREQFTVAQVAERGLFAKDPTVSAYSLGPLGASPLSTRVDVAVVDDPALMRTVGDEELSERFEAEFESRVEPGGALFVVGQRLHAQDLYGTLAARTWTDDAGEQHPAYKTITFPAHFDHEGTIHTEWDGESGCLLDADRLPYRKLQREMSKPSYSAMFQQDVQTTAEGGLVELQWINGGIDSAGLEAIGCLDRDRAFWEPFTKKDGRPLVWYVTIDPAEGSQESNASWWAFEVWGVDPTNRVRFLLYGIRTRGTYSDILSHSDSKAESGGFSGLLDDIVYKAANVGARLSALVIEDNKARGFLASSDFQRWHRNRWPEMKLIRFQVTGQNKNDPVTGVRALLADQYRNGTARWPWKSGGSLEALDYLRVKMAELTHVRPKTNDTVMSEWVGISSLNEIIAAGSRPPSQPDLSSLPPYLRRQVRIAPRGNVESDNGKGEDIDWEHRRALGLDPPIRRAPGPPAGHPVTNPNAVTVARYDWESWGSGNGDDSSGSSKPRTTSRRKLGSPFSSGHAFSDPFARRRH